MGFPNVKTKPSTGQVLNYSTATISTAATGLQSVMPANASRTYLVFQNISDTLMRIDFGGQVSEESGIQVQPSGSVTFNAAWVPSQEVFVRCSSTTKKFVAKEGI